MNHITITKLSDLLKPINESIYISGEQYLIDEEIFHNMWALSFSDNLLKKIEVQDLENFLFDLLKKRSLQLSLMDPISAAIFYIWFDKQALQLRFNFISDVNQSLPFGCQLNLLDSPHSILHDFLLTTRQVINEGDDITFLEPGDDIDDEPEETYILNVYSQIISPPTN